MTIFNPARFSVDPERKKYVAAFSLYLWLPIVAISGCSWMILGWFFPRFASDLHRRQFSAVLNLYVWLPTVAISGVSWMLWGWFSSSAQTYDDPQGVWFQRSGSIAVALAISAEVYLAEIDRTLGANSVHAIEFRKKHAASLRFHLHFFILLAFVGTVVWGYGDLFWDRYH